MGAAVRSPEGFGRRARRARTAGGLLLVVALAAGCRSYDPEDDPIVSSSEPTVASTVATIATTVTTAATTSAAPAPTTATTRRAVTTTTTRPPTRAEATSRLCAAVASADEAVQRGNFVTGGLRLGAGLSANEKQADPAVVAAARAMLSAGLKMDVEGYATARQQAAAACAKAGSPIRLVGPVQCITFPCP